jgi:hypothetical protein
MADTLRVCDILKDAQIPDSQARAITQAIRESDTAVALDVRTVLEERLPDVITKAVLRADLAELKAEIARWMFAFWVGQMAATAGIVFTAFKLWR